MRHEELLCSASEGGPAPGCGKRMVGKEWQWLGGGGGVKAVQSWVGEVG